MGYTPPPLTAAQVWIYATRTLTQTQFPFWSAIITQTQGSVSIPAGSSGTIEIQPASGETWLVWLDFVIGSDDSGSYIYYKDYDGATARSHIIRITGGTYGDTYPHLGVQKILTNTLYAQLLAYNASATAHTLSYGYSGFKLSKPHWRPERLNQTNDPPWKRALTQALPSNIAVLEPYACEVYMEDVGDYVPVIILEEDTVLATDPITGFPVERLTVLVEADWLSTNLTTIKNDAAATDSMGYKKYLDKWASEGITLDP